LNGPRPLRWTGNDEEKIIALSTSYLTDDTLQSLVYTEKTKDDEAEDGNSTADSNKVDDAFVNVKYSTEAVEAIAAAEPDDS